MSSGKEKILRELEYPFLGFPNPKQFEAVVRAVFYDSHVWPLRAL